jgi:hypothetical protein
MLAVSPEVLHEKYLDVESCVEAVRDYQAQIIIFMAKRNRKDKKLFKPNEETTIQSLFSGMESKFRYNRDKYDQFLNPF